MKCLIQTEYQLCCSGAQRHMCFTSFSLKLSRVWYSISCRHPYVTEPFQKVLCFYFKGCLNWIAGSVCRTLPPLCGLPRKKTGRKGNALVLFVYIVASVREIILFCFQRILGFLKMWVFQRGFSARSVWFEWWRQWRGYRKQSKLRNSYRTVMGMWKMQVWVPRFDSPLGSTSCLQGINQSWLQRLSLVLHQLVPAQGPEQHCWKWVWPRSCPSAGTVGQTLCLHGHGYLNIFFSPSLSIRI